MASMGKVVQCDCGFEARGGHEDELVAEVRRHAWEAHGMALSPDQALLLASRAELDATVPSRKPVHDPSQNIMSDREEEECRRRGDRQTEKGSAGGSCSASRWQHWWWRGWR